MKKFLGICMMLALCLSGCAKEKPVASEQEILTGENIKVATSFYPIYLMTLYITDGAEGVEVENMAQPQTGCLHDYDLTTEDMKMLDQADVFFMNGLGMERFLDQARAQNPDLYIVETGEYAQILLEEEHSYAHDDEEDDDYHEERDEEADRADDDDTVNSHVWLHPVNAARQAEAIGNTMIELDEANADIYRANIKSFTEKMKELEMEGKKLQARRGIPTAAFHEGFLYLEEWCGLNEEIGIFPEEHQTPSAGELAEAMDEAREDGIHYFLTAADGGESYAKMMAEETGGVVIELNPLTRGNGDKDEFIQGMEDNLAAITGIFDEA